MDISHLAYRTLARSLTAVLKDLLYVFMRERLAAFAHRRDHGLDVRDESLLACAVVALIGLVHGRERALVLDKPVNVVDVARTLAAGIGDDTHDRFHYLILGAEQRNGIAVALAHLFSVGTRHYGDGLKDFLFRFLKRLAEREIKFCGRFARVFHVLSLVLSHGHRVRSE